MNIQRLISIFLFMFLVSSCAGIKNVQVMKEAEPYNGPVEIAMTPTSPGPTDEWLFTMIIKTRTGGPDGSNCYEAAGLLPEGSLMDEVKTKSAALGAEKLIFECGGVGTVAACTCSAKGYKAK